MREWRERRDRKGRERVTRSESKRETSLEKRQDICWDVFKKKKKKGSFILFLIKS